MLAGDPVAQLHAGDDDHPGDRPVRGRLHADVIGRRLGITIQVLKEEYADTGQIGIVAHWRGDVAPARPAAFAVYRAIQGALK